MCGCPSLTLLILVQSTPDSMRWLKVPEVAKILNPILINSDATSQMGFLSWSLTLIKTFPVLGSITPAALWALKYASPNVFPNPITSPVDFISGPSNTSTSGNLLNGKTASFTEK